MTFRITDELLEYWGEIYVRLGLRRYVTFDGFIRAPRMCLLAIDSGEYRPLLPEQRSVQQRIDDACDGLQTAIAALEREIEMLPRRNGAPVERLRHHRRPKRSAAAHFTARESL